MEHGGSNAVKRRNNFPDFSFNQNMILTYQTKPNITYSIKSKRLPYTIFFWGGGEGGGFQSTQYIGFIINIPIFFGENLMHKICHKYCLLKHIVQDYRDIS